MVLRVPFSIKPSYPCHVDISSMLLKKKEKKKNAGVGMIISFVLAESVSRGFGVVTSRLAGMPQSNRGK